jgi:phospholipid/cholesterol/gamma-HCH transport system ATP-binding protein
MPAALSGGMARRVGLARAIALDPMLIIYDEPFGGLDPISCSVIGNLIRRLNDALASTSIVVSYDAAESMRVIDYLYLISDGVVAAAGPAEEMRDSKDPFVRQFLDGAPDGPVPFHHRHDAYSADLGLGSIPE